MILFEEDFAREGAIVDYSTRNTSFIRMSVLLRQMGVKNNKFMLALYQKELMGIDPHNLKDQSPEIRLKIAYECKINYWYYLREIVRVPAQGSPEPGFYILNRANLALSWVFMNNYAAFLTMPRQNGKTIATIVLDSYLFYVAGTNLNIGMFAKDNALLQENVDRLKTIRDGLPKYLLNRTQRDEDNKEGLSYEELGNHYLTFVAQKDKRAAKGQGRGQTMAFGHWDEFAYYDNIDLSYNTAKSATDTGQQLARQAGIRCGNIITTTAGYVSDTSGEYAYGIKQSCLRFSERFYDLQNADELKKVVKANSTNNMFYLEYSYAQLGKSHEWFSEVTAGLTPEQIATDYLNKWPSGSGATIFPKHILDRLDSSRREADFPSLFESLVLRWYRPEKDIKSEMFKRKPMIIGCDTSDNVGRDFTTLVGIDPSDMSTVFTARCNTTNLTYIAQCVVKLLEEFPRSIFIPERNKNGAFLIDLILVTLKSKSKPFNPFTRIYNTVVQEYSDMRDKVNIYSEDPTNGVVRKYFGFTTTRSESSRDMLYKTVLMQSVSRNAERIYDCDIIDEINGVTTNKGRLDHADGKHDDSLIAWLLACFLVMYGRNLHMYGLAAEELFVGVDDSGHAIDPVEKQNQIAYTRRIKELEKLINSIIPEAVRRQYEVELMHLRTLVKEGVIDENIMSIAQVEKAAKHEYNEMVARDPNQGERMLNYFM